MKEKVGNCTVCGKEVFCLNGFLNGVLDNQKNLFCFLCIEKKEKQA
ncbi:hypothetical protein [Alteribacillus bidgolensis]|uniref:Uncharacterized protein n=1 Tax=Alteribacillus bidgolensis TaxID=930129 RepID=A0A1G8BXA0_9BACI|nr:hypothetical protein [Alteribacillus bidgolensis]SDH37831.1 hypothetical protein SAMN05216352_101115 [Alteribacillus bidgolensis]